MKKKCSRCGKEYDSNVNFCTVCGQDLQGNNESSADANSHFPRPAGPHFPARQGHIKRPVLESGTGVQGREGLHPASL